MGDQQIKEMREAFDLFDTDGGGTIDWDEFVLLMGGKMSDKDMKEDMIKAFKLFDADNTGKVSFKNLEAVAKELGESMSKEELQGMMDEAATDGTGEVSQEEFLRVMKAANLC